MFFPDKLKAYLEALRVLKPGGAFLFNVWDRIDRNQIPETVADAIAAYYPADPPSFLRRTPHGYNDTEIITGHLQNAGFGNIVFETVKVRSRCSSHRDPAIGFCQGSPMRAEIVARDPSGLEAATDAAAAALSQRFGTGAIEGDIQAIVFTATR
jgi:SAM-dependent methyltransferase